MASKDKDETKNQTSDAAASTAPASATADNSKEQAIAAAKEEAEARARGDLEAKVTALTAESAGLAKENAELKGQLAKETALRESIQAERDTLRARLQQEQVVTVDLKSGEAQLTESVTIPTGKTRINGRVGDVLLRDGSEEAVKATQARLGGEYRVFSVPKDRFDEIAAKKLATVRA